MINLPNNCRAGKFSVYPSNWNTAKADVTLTWCISYWFYDDNIGKRKKVPIKGMNHLHDLEEKQAATELLIDDELKEIKERAFNRFTKTYGHVPQEDFTDYEIDPSTPFLKAFNAAKEKLTCSKTTKENITSALKYISQAADQLHMNMAIKDIRRRHIKALLNKCAKIKSTWTSNTFNAYRSYLIMLFSELLELEATETNAARDIKKQKHAVKNRRIPTPEECERIDAYAKKYDVRFWRIIHIFHASGARTTELFKLQGKHVDLERQTIEYKVLKGNNYKWIQRPIKNIVKHLWVDAMKDCGPEDYVFSKGLKPGAAPISPRQMDRRWKLHVKDKLGIDCDWYSLKYLNTTQMMDELSLFSDSDAEKKVAEMNGHASTAMVVKIYDVKNKFRKDNKIKSVGNKFAG